MVNTKQEKIEFRAEIFQEDGVYVGMSPELDVSSFGETAEEAKKALTEAVAAFVEGCRMLGTLEEVLEESGFTKHHGKWLSRMPLSEERLTIAL